MLAYMNRESLERTLSTGNATFFSRERQALWTKGETSGHLLRVSAVYCDCDADTLVLMVDPEGPSCHTGRPSCFYRRVDAQGSLSDEPVEVLLRNVTGPGGTTEAALGVLMAPDGIQPLFDRAVAAATRRSRELA